MKINKNICIGISIVLLISIIIILAICYFGKNHFSNLNDSNDFKQLSYNDFVKEIVNKSWGDYNPSNPCSFDKQKITGTWYIDVNNDPYLKLDYQNLNEYDGIPIMVPCKNRKYLFNKSFFTEDHFDKLKNFIGKLNNTENYLIQPKDYSDISKGWQKACLKENKICQGSDIKCCSDFHCCTDTSQHNCNMDNSGKCVKISS